MPALENEKHERFCQLLLTDPESRAGRVYEQVGYKARDAQRGISGKTRIFNRGGEG